MFEFRVRVLIALLAVAAAVLVTRLIDMQIVHADVYRKQAEDALLLPARDIPAVRGRILDRRGVELATEEPSWAITLHYGIISDDSAYRESTISRLLRQDHYGEDLTHAEVEERFEQDLARMWSDLGRFSGETVDELKTRAEEIHQRIQAIRDAVSQRRGFDAPVREERMHHAIIEGMDDQQQVAARDIIGRYPWVYIDDATRRVNHAGESMVHIIGRLGAVTAEHLEDDPFPDDPLRRYYGDEQLGISGVERAAESTLRGRRGRFQKTLEDVVIEDILPRDGQDITLSIRLDLQKKLYAMFGRAIAATTTSTGGAIVVVHVPTREVLAMVSYPGYAPISFERSYQALRRDTRRLPLRFRAVANSYPPGSIVKPLTCLAGLTSGKITIGTQFDCQGWLYPENHNSPRCWYPAGAGYPSHHGPLTAEEAIMRSCNIFMYNVGQLLGVETLTRYFEMAGFGRPSGVGLPEEVYGINPTPSWLGKNRSQPVRLGDARNYAIGQGEVELTPVQGANLMATYASGESRPLVLMKGVDEGAAWQLPGSAAIWRAIRSGIYRVVNDPHGTANRTAEWRKGGYALCGKTGSATAVPWPVSYRVPYVDPNGRKNVAIIPASRKADAVSDFIRLYPNCAFNHREVEIAERWPSMAAEHGNHSHAWFGGFLQPLTSSGEPRWSEEAPIAFAVLVEFGGSGGRTAGPVAQQVAEVCFDILGPDLDPDGEPPIAADEDQP